MKLEQIMESKPERVEISYHTMRLIVGLLAIFLAILTSLFSPKTLSSISASYHAGRPARDIFVGFLFAICSFLLAYNGKSTFEMVLSKIAAFAAIGVAMFPCKCDEPVANNAYIHYASAAVMFLILTIFCYLFFRGAKEKEGTEAKVRKYIYAACGLVMLICVASMALDYLLGEKISNNFENFTFWAEAVALTAFGISWLVASRNLPLITSEKDRISLLPELK